MLSSLVIVIAAIGHSERLYRTLVSLAECEELDNYEQTIVVENGPRSSTESTVNCFKDRCTARDLHSAPQKAVR